MIYLNKGDGTWEKKKPAQGDRSYGDALAATQMYKCGENLCAKIVKVVDAQKTDDKNPEASRRSRPATLVRTRNRQQDG